MGPIRSRDNARVRRWRSLISDPRARRAERRAIAEGEHLVGALLEAGWKVEALLVAAGEEQRHAPLAARAGATPVVLSDAVFRSVADVESPSGIAAEIALPGRAADLGAAPSCVFLDGIQDSGNVGTILRSAAAFGIRTAVLGAGCADAWSPKVLRAGMGAHFAMRIEECAGLAEAIARFGGRVACTIVRGGKPLPQADLSGRIGWLFGAEGKGVDPALAASATLQVTIPMPGGTESLNVAAAAAICFYELSRRAARS